MTGGKNPSRIRRDSFEEHEWLKAVEIAWTPSPARFKTDRIQFTYWDKDERRKAGIPGGSGWVVSASYQVMSGFIPFTRFGHSDGSAGVAAESATSIGFELTPDMQLLLNPANYPDESSVWIAGLRAILTL